VKKTEVAGVAKGELDNALKEKTNFVNANTNIFVDLKPETIRG